MSLLWPVTNIPLVVIPPVRTELAATRTYYVLKTGNDANTGLANDAAHAFLTVQHAVDVARTLDQFGYAVIIQVGDGTYAEQITVNPVQVGIGNFTIQGNAGIPGNVIINSVGDAVTVYGPSYLLIKDCRIQSTTSGIHARRGALVDFQNVEFNTCTTYHIQSREYSRIRASGNYGIIGDSGRHIQATNGGMFLVDSVLTITLTGLRAFTIFAFAGNLSLTLVDSTQATIVGAATGQRYYAAYNAVIQTYGGGANFFPGNAAGATVNGGIYV